MPGFNTSVANMPSHALKNFAYCHKAVLDRVWNLWQLAIVAPASFSMAHRAGLPRSSAAQALTG